MAFDDTRPRLGCVSEKCEQCLGAEWDSLRREKGLLGIRRDREPVVIEFGNWLSSQVQAAVSRILVEEMLGYEVCSRPATGRRDVAPDAAALLGGTATATSSHGRLLPYCPLFGDADDRPLLGSDGATIPGAVGAVDIALYAAAEA